MAYTAPTIIASGTTWAQLQAGGVSAVLDKLIAANLAATSAPTVAATVAATGGGATGGLLAAGTYYATVTETNGIGETTAGPETAQFTVGATNIPRITFQTLKAGNTARKVYLTAANGASGTEVLYAAGITTATYDMATAAVANSRAVPPPTVNTTGLTTAKLRLIRSAKIGSLQDVYRAMGTLIRNFVAGEAMNYQELTTKHQDAVTAFALLLALGNEIGVLIDANAGTFGGAATGASGSRRTVRTWP